MSTLTEYRHIVTGSDGTARIGNTRYKVMHLAAEHYHYGWTAEELLRQHPDLKPEQVYAALTYFYDHYDQFLAEMTASADEVETYRGKQRLSRAELLARCCSEEEVADQVLFLPLD